ncbi:helix-turn-helix domain-containing protein [Solemya velum gill symbiont]|uniref:helix-turn-helix domain-containing protein n=1 Tax=Solemya velum gill symbiont TaxID=2340 RepID=UPI000996D92A|nr:helix-turn-helix domain-containing protein [Solemya velum gill symbiont]OOY57532.1 DNA-binding protein [Solemya velum gill symbiont]OOY58556.1 DNA-binding protein [Solemya velum gill symbiont]OOY71178.1 DNA-binding protein [Solemya velum gill symbiont]OOY80968.1 DNA-binding protein [Solemya velum gill symbiont]OOY84057.1 DNA-binding protein [Solemya velum gill symbiont]
MANYNPNLVKINRNYTFEELAMVFGVHKNTVSSWVKNGLPCLKERRPFLILGTEARAYLQQQRTVKKQKCKPDEFFCMRCKAPTKPAENYVEYMPLSATKGRLTGFCGRCECVVNKFISFDSLARYSVIFNLSVPKALEHINDCDNPLLNSDLKK